MNIAEMKLKVSEINSKLNDTNYEKFADKHPRTNRPEKITSYFSQLLNELDRLVSQASKRFPRAQVDSFFEEGKDLLDVKRRAINNSDFEKGKGILVQTVSIIEQNLIAEERKTQLKDPNPVNKNVIPNQSTMIFVSYDEEQILREIQTVFGTLGVLDPEIGNLQTTERKQLKSLDTASSRIDEIRSCSSAIICLPPDNSPDNSINALAYLDLGACLALFPKQTLLIHQGSELPDNLVGKVETFQYLGSLDFQKGMELARQILKVLHKDS